MGRIEAKIIYSNTNILVVNKPAGVPVTKDRGGAVQLKDILDSQLPPEEIASLRLVHRLDKFTVLLIADKFA